MFKPESERKAITLLAHFFDEMSAIVQKSSEPSIATLKLNWWKEEIQFLFQGKARHPLSQALFPLIQQYPLHQEWFQQIIQSKLVEVDPQFNDQQALLDYCCDNRGAFHLLICNMDSSPEEHLHQFAILSGVAFRLIEIIRFFGKNYRQGKIFFPQETLATHSLAAENLLKAENQPALKTLFKNQAELAKKTYQQALNLLPQTAYRAQTPLLILANIQLALLNEMAQDNFQVLDQKYSLTPVRKWWIAWRTHQQAKKQKKYYQ